MDYQSIGQIKQIMGTDIVESTRKVNVYISKGWKLLNVLQLTDVNHDGGYSCALFILGHEDATAAHPTAHDFLTEAQIKLMEDINVYRYGQNMD